MVHPLSLNDVVLKIYGNVNLKRRKKKGGNQVTSPADAQTQTWRKTKCYKAQHKENVKFVSNWQSPHHQRRWRGKKSSWGSRIKENFENTCWIYIKRSNYSQSTSTTPPSPPPPQASWVAEVPRVKQNTIRIKKQFGGRSLYRVKSRTTTTIVPVNH